MSQTVSLGRGGSLLVSPSGASGLRVKIRNGATGGEISVTAAGQTADLHLSSWESRELQVCLIGKELLVPVVVSPAEGLRPLDIDPSSRDGRWLGCQVQIELF